MKKTFFTLAVICVLGVGMAGVLLWRGVIPSSSASAEDSGVRSNPATQGIAIVDDSPCAMKIVQVRQAPSCEEGWEIFKGGLASCRDQVVTMSEATFYYEEEITRLVECFDKEQNANRSLAVLREAKSWGEWKIDHGPTICPGDSYVQAAIEVREKSPSLCLQKSELGSFLNRHAAERKWTQFLDEAQRSPQVVMVGAWETDTHCVSPRNEILTLLQVAVKDQGEWKVSKSPEDELTYFVGANPPEDFKLVLTFSPVADCLSLSNIDYNIPE
ncbi:MAG TPA: hypothetical protein PL182_03900 [Pseudobdellovibrionaceae bacterium]|nr:hypothetical protein [Pseudobdellovibrionaceae bacterium]